MRIVNVPGNIVNPLHTVTIGGKRSHERFPGAIVYVRQCAKWMRAFRRFCEQHNMGIVVRTDGGKELLVCEPGMDWDGVETVCTVGAWEVIGTGEDLQELTVHPMLSSWHPVIGCSVRTSGAGAGTVKERKFPKAKEPNESEWTRIHNAYRDAVRNGNTKRADELLAELGANHESNNR